ncbi:MAG: L-threonylcarbamoyladenylate synthase [Marmoricola sp.]
MAQRFDTSDPDELERGLAAAVTAVRGGELIVLPTDTVYGVGADAFSPAAVQRLLEAKGRARDMPPPVLVSEATTLDALASTVPDWVRSLVEEYWPGPLTVVCHQQPSLQWDLGETRGTVAIRMPRDDIAVELLSRTGPMAVSSANLTGRSPATDADAAAEMLGESVEVVLDGGPTPGERPSTIVDCTTERPGVLREGVIAVDELRVFLSGLGVDCGRLDEPDA